MFENNNKITGAKKNMPVQYSAKIKNKFHYQKKKKKKKKQKCYVYKY
jgi:hypothetical protein